MIWIKEHAVNKIPFVMSVMEYLLLAIMITFFSQKPRLAFLILVLES